MITAVIAKFVCYEIEKYGVSEQTKLTAVFEPTPGGSEENRRFYTASPAGQLSLTVDNPNVHGFFEKGEHYYLTISKAPLDADAG